MEQPAIVMEARNWPDTGSGGAFAGDPAGDRDQGAGPDLDGKPDIRPVQPGERIKALDVLRGFAILGILPINVQFFRHPASGEALRFDWHSLGTFEYAIEFARVTLVQGKFYALFSILFGLGFALQLGRIEQRGGRFALRFLWRMILLFGIGAAHAIVIWDGDILKSYALGGVILLLFFVIKRGLDRVIRKLSRGRWTRMGPISALILAILLIVLPMTGWAVAVHRSVQVRAAVAAGETLTESQEKEWKRIEKRDNYWVDPERKKERDEERTLYATGSYGEVVQHRASKLVADLLGGLPQLILFVSLFLLGAYLGRCNHIGRADELKRGFSRLLVIAAMIGVPTALAYAWFTATTPDVEVRDWRMWQSGLVMVVSQFALALAYIAMIVLLMGTRAARWLQHLAPVGRMALSNYVMASVLGTVVFYGHGFGAMSVAGVGGELLFMLGVVALQIPLSRLWLTHFRFGPLEWLWRSLSYLRLQPMRQVRGNPAPA